MPESTDQSPPFGDPDRAALLLANLGRLRTELAALRVTVTSPDGSVSVIAGPGGGIQAVQLTAEAVDLPPSSLGDRIVTAAAKAAEQAAQATSTLTAEVTGRQVDPDVIAGRLPSARRLESALPQVPLPDADAEVGVGVGVVDGPMNRLQQIRADALAKLATYEQIAAELADLVVREVSADGGVTVELAEGNRLVGVKVTPRALQQGHQEVAGQITRTIQLASAALARIVAVKVQRMTDQVDVVAEVEKYQPGADGGPRGDAWAHLDQD